DAGAWRDHGGNDRYGEQRRAARSYRRGICRHRGGKNGPAARAQERPARRVAGSRWYLGGKIVDVIVRVLAAVLRADLAVVVVIDGMRRRGRALVKAVGDGSPRDRINDRAGVVG